MATFADHDAYISAAPEAFRPVLGHIRGILREALPEAEETVAYNMPGFRFGGTVIASYAAFSKQIGVYIRGESIAAHADEIAAAGRKATKTGITFPPGKPLADDLLTRMARTSLEVVRAG